MRLILITLLALALTACTGNTKPETPKERLVVAEFTYQAMLGAVNDLITAGAITAETADEAELLLANSKAALDTFRSAVEAGAVGTKIDRAALAADIAFNALVQFLELRQSAQLVIYYPERYTA